jgi:ankyrin repeat protein
LGRVGGARAVDPLIAALNDAGPGVRLQAAEALGHIGDPRAVDPLIALLKDPEPFVRVGVARALGHIGDPRAIGPVVAATHDPDDPEHYVHWGAIAAFGDLAKDPRAAEQLIAALKDTDSEVRWIAAEALGNLKDPRAVAPLTAALQDPNALVRNRAAAALDLMSIAQTPPGDGSIGTAEGGGASRSKAVPAQAKVPGGLAGVNAHDKDGETALMGAAYQGDLEVVRTLLSEGADVNEKTTASLAMGGLQLNSDFTGTSTLVIFSPGSTALMFAVEGDHSEVVQVLLDMGADVNARDWDGYTPLMKASTTAHGDIVRLLLAKGADVNATAYPKGLTAVTALSLASQSGHHTIKDLLIKAGAR